MPFCHSSANKVLLASVCFGYAAFSCLQHTHRGRNTRTRLEIRTRTDRTGVAAVYRRLVWSGMIWFRVWFSLRLVVVSGFDEIGKDCASFFFFPAGHSTWSSRLIPNQRRSTSGHFVFGREEWRMNERPSYRHSSRDQQTTVECACRMVNGIRCGREDEKNEWNTWPNALESSSVNKRPECDRDDAEDATDDVDRVWYT